MSSGFLRLWFKVEILNRKNQVTYQEGNSDKMFWLAFTEALITYVALLMSDNQAPLVYYGPLRTIIILQCNGNRIRDGRRCRKGQQVSKKIVNMAFLAKYTKLVSLSMATIAYCLSSLHHFSLFIFLLRSSGSAIFVWPLPPPCLSEGEVTLPCSYQIWAFVNCRIRIVVAPDHERMGK